MINVLSYINSVILTMFLALSFGLSEGQSQVTELTIPLVKDSEIDNISMETGVQDYSLEMTNGEQWNVRIMVPELEEEKKYPLVLAMHWAGDHEAFRTYSDCLIFPAFEDIDAIIIVPSSPRLLAYIGLTPIMKSVLLIYCQNSVIYFQ